MKSSSPSVCLFPVLLIAFATATTYYPRFGSGWWQNNPPSFTKVCLYSSDPKQFTPMCVMCSNILYPIALNTCVKGSAIPLNVTYTQANCIVGNCMVDLHPPIPNFKKKGKREAVETKLETDDPLDGLSLADLSRTTDGSVPYTMIIDGHNVTITSVEEYFVHSDTPDPTDDYDLEL